MALFLALYRASDFADAKTKARAIHDYQGRGHSLGLHSRDDKRAHELAMDMQACRSLSIRHIVSPLVGHLTMVCRFHFLWDVDHGAAIQLMTI